MDDGRAAPRVKICGITRVDDAAVAGRAGADYVGAVLTAGLRRSVAPEVAARFPGAAGRPLVGVTVDEPLPHLVELARRAGASVLQLHGGEEPALVAALREEGEWEVWKALTVRTAGQALAEVDRYAGLIDGVVLDGWHPEHAGGAGVRFPWELVESVRHRFPGEMRLIVAGGLVADNVADASARLAPDVVDVSSGVERSVGVKDPALVRAFIGAAQRIPQP